MVWSHKASGKEQTLLKLKHQLSTCMQFASCSVRMYLRKVNRGCFKSVWTNDRGCHLSGEDGGSIKVMDVVSNGAMLSTRRKKEEGERTVFSPGEVRQMKEQERDDRMEEEMKVQTSSLQHSSPLLSSPYTFPIWPVALCPASLISIIIKPALFPPRVGQPCVSPQLAERNTCTQVAPRGCMSSSSSRLYTQPL